MRPSTLLASLVLPAFALADHAASQFSRRHRGSGLVKRGSTSLQKRFDDARFSYYDITTGEVACGGYYQPGDFVVALNSAQFAGGENCGKTFTISYGGKTTTAKIVDECPGCPWGGLDLTEGLFSYFASESEGIIYGEWNWGGAAAAPATKPKPKQTPTSKPTTTWHAPTPSWTPTPTPDTDDDNSGSDAPESTPTPKPTSSSTPAPALAPVPRTPLAVQLGLAASGSTVDGTNNLNLANYAVLNFGGLVMTA